MLTNTLTCVYTKYTIFIFEIFINKEPKIRYKLFVMKKCLYLFLLFFISLFSIQLQAQEQAVRFANGNFITGSNIKKQGFKKENIEPARFGDSYYVVVQFEILPAKQAQDNLKKAGIQLEEYIPGNAYLAAINKNFDFATARQYGINSINTLPAIYKIGKQLNDYQQLNGKKDGTLIAVKYSATLQKDIVKRELQNTGAVVVYTKYESDNIIFIETEKKTIEAIAALPFVNSLNLQALKDKPLNYNSTAVHGIDALNAANGKNLNGKGVTIGIGDNADISTHIDFAGRLILRTPWQPDNHGTHVSGTTAGAGIINIKYHGMAPKATLINQLFSDIITNAPVYITDNNMVLSNNSYYSGIDNCPGEGVYDVLSNYVDKQMGSYKQLLHVVAAGNDGALSCAAFPTSFATVKSGWQTAKNVLTVGAMNAQNYTIASFSSRGPVADGRIKPEITANGWAVTSTIANNNYSTNYGTSMACPAVTGSLSLMYERYRQLHGGANPTSDLIKALVCNTAEDLGNVGPDYTFGFGMLNARKAVEAIENSRYFINTISNGGTAAQIITVPANARRLKVMLYWADTAAAANAAMSLVNDLDLTVTEPSAVMHRPMVLNPAPFSVNNVAIEGVDHTNNIEQVIIENPSAGNYTINVAGFAVPYGPQQYVISYEIIQPSVTVEYPFGGETLVPGETENIRWSAYGNEGNTFNIEYSTNNGSSWTTLNNNAAADSRTYPWTVPATITNNALVRVSRNSTSLTGQSTTNFVILGQPAVSTINVCEGAVQLNWAAVSGATSYDIVQLTGDSMKVIANTSANVFLLKGLQKNVTTWLGITAKNGVFSGRRSISVGTLPNSGPCTLSAFDNDVKVDSIVGPNTARQHFANESNAIGPVKILIKNSGAVPVTGPFTVSYSYGATPVTEIINTVIAAGGTYTYTFTGLYPVISSGYKYNFKAWITVAADANHLNDTAYKTVKLINNDPIAVMPVTEGFESMTDADYTKPEMAIGDNSFLDFSASTSKGRVRTFVNTGFARTGNRSLTLDQSPFSSTTATVDSFIVNYNLVSYAANQLRFDFYYFNHGQENNPNNKIWIRGSENDKWVEAYDLFINQAEVGQWKQGHFNINEVLGNTLPAQTITQTFQIKIGEEGYTSANTVKPLTAIDDGYTFDDIVLNQALNDLAVKNILSPAKTGCGLTANTPVTVTVKNYNNTTLNNIIINYQVNGGAIVTEIIPSIAANQSLDYTFVKTADLSAYIDYGINVWVNYAADNYAVNDSILNYTLHNSPVITSYPYLQSFENSDGNFFTKGLNTSWQWGTPAKTIINKAPNGVKAWVTNLTGNYNNNESSYLYSPCFDLTGLVKPVLSFSHIIDVELDYDFNWVEYSTDGIVWKKLGNASSGTNWYDNPVGNNWKLSNKKWHVASIDIPVTAANIRFRFVLTSDEGVTKEGIGLDDISVHEKSDVPTSNIITNVSIPSVTGNNWVPFNIGNQSTGPWYVLAEMNPNGQDLGKVDLALYSNTTGAVRNSNNQYYLDRNFVIHPTNPPTGNIGVRLYFTVAEADSLINAKNCSSCIKPSDAYELGVTKYSGTMAEENGTLDDDIYGFFQYFTPANTAIVPHGNGYYAEFTVNSFSEFWFNNGGANSSQPLLLTLFAFEASKQSGKALLGWKTKNEINTAKFFIERSKDGRNFASLGSIAANSTNGQGQYSFTDTQPFSSINYYRLKMVQRNGVYTFTDIRKLDFSNKGDDFLIYPNPVKNAIISISSSANCTNALLYDESGKLVKSFVLQGKNNTINIVGIAKGVYQLKIISVNSTHTEKVLVQ